jgi:hypothetical protein
MVNPWRGEVMLRADGRTHTLRLSLGALAALEAALEAEGLLDLADRIDRGGLRTREVIAILAAGFQGAGQPVDAAAVADMAIEGGAAEAMRVAIALMTAAFGVQPP